MQRKKEKKHYLINFVSTCTGHPTFLIEFILMRLCSTYIISNHEQTHIYVDVCSVDTMQLRCYQQIYEYAGRKGSDSPNELKYIKYINSGRETARRKNKSYRNKNKINAEAIRS